ncbi:pectinesterase family protein [Undibacterium fentianense]|uniref:Pectin lyase fold-containing protein n=1 Tax=Undibacterium fentianense TaxID=2828728 RepID=A0A941E214_9BURK|nr:pectinesterase family protein [Undibacterium fentianense]MBR7799526.1 pectin lyase fold-containing protein [Undibacterium fentianense]
MSLALMLGMASILSIPITNAQDTRQVREPHFPKVCTVLTATQTYAEGLRQLDSLRIQAALDACPVGQAVQLAANNEKDSFQSGPLQIPSGVGLIIDRDATLYASTDANLYDKGGKTCGVNAEKGRTCNPFITIENAKGSGIYGDGVIDGQGGQLVQGKSETWWQMARRAQREKNEHNIPRLIEIKKSQDITFYRIRLRNSPNFHVTVSQSDGFTAWGIKIDTPADARNTDGIDPISSRNITIAHSYIRTGDDNIAIKGGNSGATEHVSILNSHFYSGHGMSIGSETNSGVRRILVRNLSLDGTTSGLRIKSDASRGGVVEQVRYEDICIRNSKRPIDLDTRYDQAAVGDKIPTYKDIVFERVHSLTPGRIVLRAYDRTHPMSVAFAQSSAAANSPQLIQFAHLQIAQENITVGEQAENLVWDTPSSSACANRFADFPVHTPFNFRPQLSSQQAQAYSIENVLRSTGPAHKPLIDPWNPLSDALVTGAKLPVDYVVDANALADGKTQFNTVQAAINQAVLDGRQLLAAQSTKARLYILVKPGTYRELMYVPATAVPITLYSNESDAQKTKIAASAHAALLGTAYIHRFGAQFAQVDPSIQEMYASLKDRPVIGTSGSAIAWIRGHGFQAKNITFQNTYNKDQVDASAECPNTICGATAGTAPVVVVQHQAVALMVEGADKVQFENVRVLGFQDTLFLRSSAIAHTARSFFHRSYVEGNVDFIFGDTTAYFYRSEIKSLGDRSTSYVTAPNTNVRTPYGFVFNEVNFTHDGSANALAGKFYLGRQWFHTQKCTPYATINLASYRCTLADVDAYQAPVGSISKKVLETVGKTVILNSQIGQHIHPQHPWADWNKKGSLAFRPAQFSVFDYWTNLLEAGIQPIQDLGYQNLDSLAPGAAATFLGEFNNIHLEPNGEVRK